VRVKSVMRRGIETRNVNDESKEENMWEHVN
jgi:hypothetical protein